MQSIASLECEDPLVAGIAGADGASLWADGQLFTMSDDRLEQSVGFSRDHSLTGRGVGSMGGTFAGGAVQLDDGRLVLVRQGPDPATADGGGVPSQDVVIATLGDGTMRTDAILSSPSVLAIAPVRGSSKIDVVCLCSDEAAGRSWLTAEGIAEDGASVADWTNELDGSPQAWAVGGEGDGSLIGVLGVTHETLEPRLDVFDVNGQVVEVGPLDTPYQRPERLYAYGSGTASGWLIEWWEDEGNRLTLTLDGETRDVTEGVDAGVANEVLAVGDILSAYAGDELVMNVGGAEFGSSRAVIVTLDGGAISIVAELSGSPLGAVRLEDVDGDGFVDLVGAELVTGDSPVSHRSAQRIGLWLSDGEGFGDALYSQEYASGIGSLDCADLDGDGVLEVLVAHMSEESEGNRIEVLALR